MKINKLLFAVLLTALMSLSSCKDQFASLNQDPSAVTTPDPSFLMAEAIRDFQTNDYLLWFYNSQYFGVWDQMGATGAFDDQSTEMGATGGQGSQYITMLRYRNDIANLIDLGDLSYVAYYAVCDILSIYCGIFDTDVYGDIPYTEAALYRYGGPLTPEYDRLADLYTQWLDNLDEDIEMFQYEGIQFASKEDIIYNGDLTKWMKLANSLKLKIAARLYNNDPDKAKQIAKAVATSSVGYIDDAKDDFLFNKADAVTSGDGDVVYQTGNGLNTMYATANVLNFMLENLDPRVRFIYTKNSFNSKIIQGFIDDGRGDDLPTYVRDHINVVDNKFTGWKAPGEPWVRYIGMPVVLYQSSEYEAVKSEFFVTQDRYRLEMGGTSKIYTPLSTYSEETRRGRCTYTVPTLPIDGVIEDKESHPWWGMYLTAGEVNLYLAEFKLLGADLPKSAKEYYDRGVEFSVKEYDLLAGKNQIPYYKTTYNYDPFEVSIELKDGEIATMLANAGVALTGSTQEQLEKVYLQQLIHFSLQPDDQFVTARRSGYPKIGSSLIPFVKFDGFALESIPRRFEIASPNPTDIMYDIKVAAYAAQGLTTGTAQSHGGTPTVLNTERLWQDANAPQWGSPKN